MVSVSIEGSTAIFALQGLHRLWAFKTRLEIPLGHILDVRRADPTPPRGWWKIPRLPGTFIPGLLWAGTFYPGGRRIFCDVSDWRRAIVVELDGEAYQELLLEVAEPWVEVARFQAAPLG